MNIYLKTDEFHIFNSGEFTMENLNFNGIDMHLPPFHLSYNKEEIHCTELLISTVSTTEACSLKSKSVFNIDFFFFSQ